MAETTSTSEQDQSRLATYFNARSSYWGEVYDDPSCEGAIYRDRMAVSLRWIEALALPAGSRVLDVGCGAGWASLALAEAGYPVHGVDVAEAMVAQARRRVADRGLEERVRFQVGDVAELELPEASFDLVLGLGLLPWAPRPLATVQVLARLLKPGGHLLVTADSRWCLSHALDPGRNPLTRRFAWFAAGLLRRQLQTAAPAGSTPPAWRHSSRQVDAWLAEACLDKRTSASVGFGPFTWLDRRLFSEPTSISLHAGLQFLADRRLPILKGTGAHYLVLGQRPVK